MEVAGKIIELNGRNLPCLMSGGYFLFKENVRLWNDGTTVRTPSDFIAGRRHWINLDQPSPRSSRIHPWWETEFSDHQLELLSGSENMQEFSECFLSLFGGFQLGKWGYPVGSLDGFCERENPFSFESWRFWLGVPTWRAGNPSHSVPIPTFIPSSHFGRSFPRSFRMSRQVQVSNIQEALQLLDLPLEDRFIWKDWGKHPWETEENLCFFCCWMVSGAFWIYFLIFLFLDGVISWWWEKEDMIFHEVFWLFWWFLDHLQMILRGFTYKNGYRGMDITWDMIGIYWMWFLDRDTCNLLGDRA